MQMAKAHQSVHQEKTFDIVFSEIELEVWLVIERRYFVYVRTRPIRYSLDAGLGGLLACYFWRLKYRNDLTVLIGNFQNDSISASERCLPYQRVLLRVLLRVLPKCANL